MLINLRNALMAGKRLPYDNEVEYLESTGTQYIDLGFSLTPSSDLYATVMLRTTVSNGAIFGQSYRVYWGANYPAYAIANSSAGKIFFAYGPTNNLYTSDIGVGTLTDISYVGTTYTINGTTTTIPRVSSWSAIQGNAHVFCRGYADGTISPISKARVYSIKIVDNGATTHHFIPVRKGTVGYLYDRVSGKLFGNAGTGDFVLGPDVVPVEYIESHGTEYIDTGVIGRFDTVVELDNEMTMAQTSRGVFGSFSSAATGMSLFSYVANNGNLQVGAAGNNVLPYLPFDTARHLWQWAGNVVYKDGVEVFSNTYTYETTLQTLLLGNLHNASGGVYNAAYQKIYRCRIGDIRSFRPVRVGTDATSWEGAMMDVLTRRIYRNAGTGAFTYGNDLKYPIPAE